MRRTYTELNSILYSTVKRNMNNVNIKLKHYVRVGCMLPGVSGAEIGACVRWFGGCMREFGGEGILARWVGGGGWLGGGCERPAHLL
jgi:hypothetical protein